MIDLISRREGIDHFRLIVDATNKDSEYNMGFVDGLEFCISHLSTMPSAQPERKTGHWENGYCSECGEHALYWAMSSGYYSSKYCPYCGAQMREEANE